MRVLTACGECRRQFDVSGVSPGHRFHCHCGSVVEVPEVSAHDAAVVRCTSCGAARSGSEADCRFCKSSFTLKDKGEHIVCAACMTRCVCGSSFCHSCGTALTADAGTGAATDLPCPVCAESPTLFSRPLDAGLTLIECHGCAGIWLRHEEFDLVTQRARGEAALYTPQSLAKAREQNTLQQAGPMYRRCPVCKNMMTRRNHGKTSGVIVDLCVDHGVWFDADELDRILTWIRAGGEDHSRKVQEKLRDRDRRIPMDANTAAMMGESRGHTSADGLGSLIIELITRLF
jgi:Zn-finger nucleic acid-binding protein